MSFNTVLCVAGAVLVNLAGSFCQLDVCGQALLNTRIFGGADAAAGSWPWEAGIYSLTANEAFCGGSLINKDWVLTAANCFTYTSISNMVIYLGRLNKEGPNPHEINRTIIDYIIHPQYDPDSQDNDIALIQLSSSVDFTDYIKPVCLAAAASVFDHGLQCWVTGWGFTTDSYLTMTIPDKLQEVQLSILSNHDCGSTPNILCAGQLTDGVTSMCALDDGEALVCKQDSRWIQSGIVRDNLNFQNNSLSLCQNPSAFSRVSQYQDWINTYITSNQPGFITFLSSNTPDPSTPDLPDIPDNPYFPDIFSGSSPNLYFPLSLTFSIISLIFCLFL